MIYFKRTSNHVSFTLNDIFLLSFPIRTTININKALAAVKIPPSLYNFATLLLFSDHVPYVGYNEYADKLRVSAI